MAKEFSKDLSYLTAERNAELVEEILLVSWNFLLVAWKAKVDPCILLVFWETYIIGSFSTPTPPPW